jgi:neutral ceramidase
MSEPNPKTPKFRRWLWRFARIVLAVLIVVGPWPVDDSSFEGSAYQARTLGRLEQSNSVAIAGPVRVGLAEVDLTPGTPRPLAGFIGQIRTPYVGVDSPCSARALTIESASGSVTILTADLLLIDARLAKATSERAGVRPDEVYFTASHTHGGPGGWGDHPLEMLVAGAYDPAWFDELANRLASVVRRSRTGLEPAELGFVSVNAPGRQLNRVEQGKSTHDALSGLVFRPVGAAEGSPPLAILAVFGAHATVSHPVPPRLGGDYPAALAAELKQRTGARMVLFAAGAVGDASPARPRASSQASSAVKLGSFLADDLLAALPLARFDREPVVGNLRLDVDLPPVRLPFLANWLRFSPLSTWWIADRQTHLHALRLGPAALLGFPGDYSGDLADRLAASTREAGLLAVATSFDGDFRGYLVSGRIFRDVSCYETRMMSFYGPWTGEYLNDLAGEMVDRLAGTTSLRPRGVGTANDLGPRVVLAVLLIVAIGLSLSHLGELRELRRCAGLATLGVGLAAIVAAVIDPDSVAWAGFGLPAWVRLVGLFPGLWALLLAIRGKWSSSWLAFAVAFSMISASWVVVLMTARAASRRDRDLLNASPGTARSAI